MRVIIFISGIIPIAAGIFFLINEGQTFVAIAFVAGLALLASGLIGIFTYFAARSGFNMPGWTLADSLLALVLAVVTLQNRIVDDHIAPAVFGVWLIAAGAMRVAGAADMSREKAGLRVALLVLGFMCGAMGAYGFFRPFLPELSMTEILGGIFILQGVSVIAVGAGLSRRKPKVGAETRAGQKRRRV
jgi:uncharacterized membrane protein HdeD (DUF308 family)